MEQLNRDDTGKKALHLLEWTKQSFFLTGKAGTGKTTLIKQFIETTKKSVLVLAPTGIAALNVNGQTIHSLFKFNPKTTTTNIREVFGDNRKLIIEADTIIIDEISMVRSDLMDCIDISLKMNTWNYTQSFGWKQMVFVGDMYQLPPVFEFKEDSDVERNFYTYRRTKYFFSAMTFEHNWWFSWPVIELTKIYRQEDGVFKELLNAIREWNVTAKTLDDINQRVWIDLWANAIHLTTLNRMADQINSDHLNSIKKNSTMYVADYIGNTVKNISQMEDTLLVKPWAQIMMLNNTDNWRNGTVAKYKWEIDDDHCTVEIDGVEYVVDRYEQQLVIPYVELGSKTIEYKNIGTMIQFPFKLARAISIHKAQWSTFDKIYVDLWELWAFDAGQTYVALSRVRTFEGLSLSRPINMRDVILDEDIKEFFDNHKLSELQ